MWHVTPEHDMWEIVGGEYSLKISTPQFLWLGIDSILKILNKKITQWMNEWMSEKSVCRRAPATQSLLNMQKKWKSDITSTLSEHADPLTKMIKDGQYLVSSVTALSQGKTLTMHSNQHGHGIGCMVSIHKRHPIQYIVMLWRVRKKSIQKTNNLVMESYTIKWLTDNVLQDIFYKPCCPQINWITSYHPQKSLKASKPNIGNFKPQHWDTDYFDVELDIDTDMEAAHGWNFNIIWLQFLRPCIRSAINA